MKYLSDYIKEKQTECFEKNNVFFAFSEKQFNEGKKEGIKYASFSGGLIIDRTKVKSFLSEHAEIVKNGIAQDIEENGKEGVIIRELANHEASYTGNTESTEEMLTDYPITQKEILEVFKTEALKQ
jgi:hypothetical protein